MSDEHENEPEIGDAAALAMQQDDQFRAGCKATAHQCRMVQDALVEEGFSDDHAALITAHWINGSMYLQAGTGSVSLITQMIQAMTNPEGGEPE